MVFDDVIQEQADEGGAEDAATQFDADFTIMSLELSRFIAGLMQTFGGEDLSEMDQEAGAADQQPAQERDPALTEA